MPSNLPSEIELYVAGRCIGCVIGSVPDDRPSMPEDDLNRLTVGWSCPLAFA
jgi:hypothetical protein